MAETEPTSPNRTSISLPKETLTLSLFHSSLDKIKNWIDNTNPDSVRRAGDYYLAAQALLENAARELKNKAVDLAGHYRGPASAETQKQLQFLHATIRDLAAEMGKMGPPLHRYADTLAWAMQNIVVKRGEDSRSDHDTDWADMVPFYGAYRVEDRARDKFYEVNERIAEHYALLPSSVQLGFPTPTPLEIPDFKPGGFSPGGFPGGATGSVSPYGSGGTGDPYGSGGMDDLPGSGQAGLGPYDLVSSALDTNGAGGPGGEGADLFGPGPDAGTPGLIQPSGPSGLDGNGSDPSVEFPGGTGTSGQDLSVPDGETRLSGLNDTGLTGPANPVTTGLSANGVSGIGTSGGAGTGGSGVSGAGLWGAGGAGALSGTRGGASGMPMMPYGGAGHGQGGEKGQEHENSTELLEDDEVWGSGGSTTPPLLA
ncbi:hypothetical protein [Streptosporangium amethystogenes]|uniref:hypothetical protein n=1 Tax=Streptosporangium amethystogenes TaxID=2002 RepID=UPI0004C87198|nr:hypothetical protein [Streptosporangium amethystogenes]